MKHATPERYPYFSAVSSWVEGPWRAPGQLKRPSKGPSLRWGSWCEEGQRKLFPSQGVIHLSFRQINDFFPPGPLIFDCLRPSLLSSYPPAQSSQPHAIFWFRVHSPVPCEIWTALFTFILVHFPFFHSFLTCYFKQWNFCNKGWTSFWGFFNFNIFLAAVILWQW